jgi:hypothetical protein
VSNFTSEKSFTKTSFVLFDCIDNRILKADRAEGLLRLRDTDTSLIIFHEK